MQEEDHMKKFLMLSLLTGLSFVLVTSAFAAKQKKAAASKGSAKAGASAFTGTVTAVNPEAKIMTVKGKKATIGFDVSKPVFKGYNALGDVKQGDKVSVAYGADTTKVTKIAAGKKPTHKSKKKAPKP
jgi:hypothetical protein